MWVGAGRRRSPGPACGRPAPVTGLDRPRPARRRRSPSRAGGRRCPPATTLGLPRSLLARQLRVHGGPLPWVTEDDKDSIQRLDARAQPGEPAPVGVRTARAVVVDLDDQPPGLLEERDP